MGMKKKLKKVSKIPKVCWWNFVNELCKVKKTLHQTTKQTNEVKQWITTIEQNSGRASRDMKGNTRSATGAEFVPWIGIAQDKSKSSHWIQIQGQDTYRLDFISQRRNAPSANTFTGWLQKRSCQTQITLNRWGTSTETRRIIPCRISVGVRASSTIHARGRSCWSRRTAPLLHTRINSSRQAKMARSNTSSQSMWRRNNLASPMFSASKSYAANSRARRGGSWNT